VEIVVDRLSEETEREAVSRGAAVSRTEHGVRLEIDSAQKRAVEELLRSAGAELVSLRLLRGSLEDLFLKLVEDHQAENQNERQ
jgi:hypothetical protein